jgi:hypothetical protein
MLREDACTAPRLAEAATSELRSHGFPCQVQPSGGGLGVFSSRDIAAGETVLVERPAALTVCLAARTYTCATCLADARRAVGSPAWVLRCDGACGTQRYCSEACKRASALRCHPPGGSECTALRRHTPAVEMSSTLTVETADMTAQALRILSLRGTQRRVDGVPEFGYADIPSRLVRMEPSTPAALKLLCHTARTVVHGLSLGLSEEKGATGDMRAHIPVHEVRELLERVGINAYSIKGPGGTDVACACFTGYLHFVNHSCCPNVVVDSARQASAATDDGAPPAFALRALDAIPRGEELCISYIGLSGTDLGGELGMRREHLREYYGFDCVCERCRWQQDEHERELRFAERVEASLRCKASSTCGSGLGVPVTVANLACRRCVHCGGEWHQQGPL